MLEARRAEKDFQLRRDEAYSKRHAELSAAIERDMERLKSLGTIQLAYSRYRREG